MKIKENRFEAKVSKKDEQILNLKKEIFECKSISDEDKNKFITKIEYILKN